MDRPDPSPDPEFWGGRRAGDAGVPRRPRPTPYRRPFVLRILRVPELWAAFRRGHPSRSDTRRATRPRPSKGGGKERTRPVAAAVLLAALTLGWLAAGHRSRAAGTSASLGTLAAAPTTVPAPSRSIDSACAPRATRPTAPPEARCTVDGVQLEVRSYPPGTAAAAYRRASGVAARPHTGPPACERGEPDERAWSEPSAPAVAVGRYRCSFEHGRASMWWTRGDRLLHAVAADADLAALFAWWRAHPAE